MLVKMNEVSVTVVPTIFRVTLLRILRPKQNASCV